MSIVRRFTHLDNNTKINFLIYPFFLATLSYGIGFLCFGSWAGWIAKSSLFTAMTAIHPWIPFIWGGGAIIAVVAAILFIGTRKFLSIGDTAALFGSLVWIFAAFCYALTGGYLLVFAVALPNLMFWIWYFFRLSGFRRRGVPNPDIDLDREVR